MVDFGKIDDGHVDGEEPLVFRYSREERLKHAPKIVQDYYSGASQVRRGLLRSLVATKGNRFMLMSVGLCVGVVLLASVLSRRDSGSVFGVDARLSAFSFEEHVYVSVRLDAAGSRFAHQTELPLPVLARVSFIDDDGGVVAETPVTGKYDGNELFLRTTAADYGIVRVTAEVELGGESVELSADVQKK